MNSNNSIQQTLIIPETVGFRDLQRMFGLSRSHAYLLTNQGYIKSYVLRRKGALKGRRLFDVQSVRDYIHSNPATASTAKSFKV